MVTRKNPFSSRKSPDRVGDATARNKSNDDRPVMLATLRSRAHAASLRTDANHLEANHLVRRFERKRWVAVRPDAVEEDSIASFSRRATES